MGGRIIREASGWAALMLCLVLSSVGGIALPGSGRLLGRITDSAGKPLPGVQVTLVSAGADSYAVGTDEQGIYRFESLLAGRYRLRAELVGFQPYEKAEIEIGGEARSQLDFSLAILRGRRVARQASESTPQSGTPGGNTENTRPAAQSSKAGNVQPTAAESGQSNATRDRAAGRGGRAQGAGSNRAGPGPGRATQQGFQNLVLLNLPEHSDASAPGLPTANAPATPATPDSAATAMPSEAFLINGSINYGLQPGPQGGGLPDFMNDERFQALRERLGLEGPPGAGFFQSGAIGIMGAPGGPGAQGPGAGVRGLIGLAAGAARGGGVRALAAARNRLNRLQGQGFFNLRNTALDAKPYSLTGVEQNKPSYSQSRFGATVGGPLRLPGLKKSQPPPFYMINYSGQRGRNSYDATTTVPLAEERQGNFENSVLPSGGRVRLYDPLSSGSGGRGRTPFANNRIPATRLDPAAVALLRFLPLPNQPGLVQNYYFQQSLPSANDQFSARVFGRLKRGSNFNVAYTLNQNRIESGSLFPGLQSSTRSRGQNLELGTNHTFRQGLANQLQFRFNRLRNLVSNPFSFNEDILGQLGIQGLSPDPINYGIPTILFTNYGDLRLANPSLRHQQTWNLSDGLRIVKGKHAHRFGFEYRHTATNLNTDENGRGTFVFTGFASSDFDARGNPVPRTGLDFADFLLGLPQNTSRRYGGNNVYLRANLFSAYYVDDWRVRPNVTLNLGLRYEYAQPPVEKYDHIANLDVPSDISAVAVVLPGWLKTTWSFEPVTGFSTISTSTTRCIRNWPASRPSPSPRIC